MAKPVTVTVTMQDGSTTVALAIPSYQTATQLVYQVQNQGGTWDAPTADTLAGATWWPYPYFKKAVTS
jgi:hypothetical protein